ncbi:chorion class B protein PC10-like [Melitaea cinxia]|uniref:chorion class B protein PC10-like n=1 Tax=Melitaea cinxia TaxID=113334 RepID=UPI001E274D30|nr:chorion class B protein PC10-like [Melitaea cinxia]
MIQTIAGQCLRGPYNTVAYTNEIPAANLAAESAALASAGAAGIVYAPITNAIEIAPAFEPYEPVYPIACGLNSGLTLSELAASHGAGLRIKSGSNIPVSGVKVETDSMVIEGPLAITGQLPFLGAVALEGPVPAAGGGTVAYSCGNGNVGIANEEVTPVAPGYPNGYLPYNNALAPGYRNAALAAGLPTAIAGYTNGIALAEYPARSECGCATVV